MADTGVQSTGDDVNWRNIKKRGEARDEDPVITALVKEANDIFIENKKISNAEDNIDLPIIIEAFNNHLKSIKIKFSLLTEKDTEKDSSKIKGKVKEKKLTSKEITLLKIKEDNTKKRLDTFIKSLDVKNNYPSPNKNVVEFFLSILFWTLTIISNKSNDIPLSHYFDCSISFYRAIQECPFLSTSMVNQCSELLVTIENILKDKLIKKREVIYDFILNNSTLLLDSFWDRTKPKSISLYNEQKDVISLVTSNLNEKKLIFFEMPPANGKTILSAILAKVINNENKNLKNKKILLYICYNTIVRNEVAKLCIMQNVDVKFWLAVTKFDDKDSTVKTFLKPYMNCYPDWNQRGLRSKDEEKKYESEKWKKYSPNVRDQFEFYANETRFISQQKTPLTDYLNATNLPSMIISDLESAYTLLKTFPDKFITYFDEAFASSNLEITAKIMSVLGHTVLVSATLSKPEEIPTVIQDFKDRHGCKDDSFLHIIKSNKQHISCTFIDQSGYIITPHEYSEDLESLKRFLPKLNHPLIKRAYSPEVVLDIVKKMNGILPDFLKFENIFNYFGAITHESVREYICNILKYISDENQLELFNILKMCKLQKIPNMDVKTIFTESAYHYQSSKTLHVTTSDNFNDHVNNISKLFLKDSPKVSDILNDYERICNVIENQIKSIEKNGNKDSEYEMNELRKELDNLNLNWPAEFIMNSIAHAKKYGTSDLLTSPNKDIFVKKYDLGILDDVREKLLFSGIGVYQPESFTSIVMEQFLSKKEKYKFILSTPEIVYGTNISLSIIDIDHSFIKYSTRNILYQMIGRAGRRGKSNSATVIFRNNEMINIILNDEEMNIEAKQIEDNYLQTLFLKK